MSVGFHDDAIVNKFQKWLPDTIRILKPDETSRLFRTLSNDKNDKPLSLPIISLSRERDIEILDRKMGVRTFNGLILKSNEKTNIPINIIPIKLNYQLDIYTRKIEEADEYMREFVFKIINSPVIKVEIPFNNCNIIETANIYLDSTISDNSDIREKLFLDEFQRYTLKFSIDDAYLFSLPINNNVTLKEVTMNVVNTNYVTKEEKIY